MKLKKILPALAGAMILFFCTTPPQPDKPASVSSQPAPTESSPKKTTVMVKNDSPQILDLQEKINKAQPGDTVIIPDGEWENVFLRVLCCGKPDLAVTVKAQTPGKVVFTKSAYVSISGDYIVFDGVIFKDGEPSLSNGVIEIYGSHVRLTNCAIINFNYPGSNYVALRGAYNRVDHCLFQGKKTRGVMLYAIREEPLPNYHLIDHNVFRDFADGNGENGWETMRIGTSTHSQTPSYTVVEYNYFENCDGEIEIISNKSCDNTYRYNTFINSKGHLTLRHGNNCTVEKNIFITHSKPGAGGIRVMDKGHVIVNNYIEGARVGGSNVRGGIVFMNHLPAPELNEYWEIKDVLIARNNLIDCQQSFLYGGGRGTVAPTQVTFSNNILWTKSGDIFQFILSITPIKEAYYSANKFFGAALGLEKIPEGFVNSDPHLIQNKDGLWLASDNSGCVTDLILLHESDVGPETYQPVYR